MTKEEALKYLEIEDPDDLDDAYEEQLFGFKQFLLSKAPIAKLYEGRIRKLQKLEQSYNLLTGTAAPQPGSIDLPEIGSPDILEAYLAFQKARNELRRDIANAVSAPQLIVLAQALAALEKHHASHWNDMSETDEEVIVSKEPDPMYLLEAIKAYRSTGGETFEQLKNRENNPPELLIQEMKRLSLLFKKF